MVLPSRLHDVRWERSNVPRDSAALYGAEKLVITVQYRIPGKSGQRR